MSGRRVVLAVALVLTAVGASGCAGAGTSGSAGDFSGQAKGVASTLDDLQSLGRKRDGDAICTKLLSAKLVATIKQRAGRATCPTAVADVLKDVDAFDVKPDGKAAISVQGATATARVVSGSGARKRTDRIALVREAGRWKISGFGA